MKVSGRSATSNSSEYIDFEGALSEVTTGGGASSGTSIEDVLVTTQPTKIRINASSTGLASGAWLRLEVMG